MLNGSWLATAPAPSATPERCRNVRRSMVRPSIPETGRVSRLCAPETVADFLVSSMAVPSDFGGAVVLADVLGELVALGAGSRRGFLRLWLRLRGGNGRDGRDATGTDSQQEIAAGQLGCWSFHHSLLVMSGTAYLVCRNLRFGRWQINEAERNENHSCRYLAYLLRIILISSFNFYSVISNATFSSSQKERVSAATSS